jgi:GT2 family glycosyltransferase
MAERFVQSIALLEERAVAVVLVVDNTERSDENGLADRLRTVEHDVRCLRAPRNLGYFGGADYGLESYLANNSLPDWVIVSNVDIEFRDPHFLVELSRLRSDGRIGVVAPSIWSSRSRRDLNPRLVSRPRRATMKFYKIVFRNVYSLNLYEILAAVKHAAKAAIRRILPGALRPVGRTGEREVTDSVGEPTRAIYAPQGSCIAFSRRYFERGGSLKNPLFLFGEEIFVAETARELELNVVYDPRLRLWHDDHTSTGLVRSRRVATYQGQSAAYIADRYFQ